VESSNARRVFGVENVIVKKASALTAFITFTRSIVKNALEKNARFMNGWRVGGEWLASIFPNLWGPFGLGDRGEA
jgi:hypothetical protein